MNHPYTLPPRHTSLTWRRLRDHENARERAAERAEETKCKTMENLNPDLSEFLLNLEGQRLVVDKLKLIRHSKVFKKAFSVLTEEERKVQLEKIKVSDLKMFEDVVDDELKLNDKNIEKILELTETFASKTVFKKCSDFLINTSKLSNKEKFEIATKFGIYELKKALIIEGNTPKNQEEDSETIYVLSEYEVTDDCLSRMDTDMQLVILKDRVKKRENAMKNMACRRDEVVDKLLDEIEEKDEKIEEQRDEIKKLQALLREKNARITYLECREEEAMKNKKIGSESGKSTFDRLG